MPYIQVELDDEQDALLQRAADLESRSKKQQFKVSALANAREIVKKARKSDAPEQDVEGNVIADSKEVPA